MDLITHNTHLFGNECNLLTEVTQRLAFFPLVFQRVHCSTTKLFIPQEVAETPLESLVPALRSLSVLMVVCNVFLLVPMPANL